MPGHQAGLLPRVFPWYHARQGSAPLRSASTFPPSAHLSCGEPAPHSAAAAWLGVPPRANARAEPGNRTRRPARDDARAPGTMNQFMFDLGDETTARSSTIAVGEQPPQRLENFGVNAVSDTELLAMILQG